MLGHGSLCIKKRFLRFVKLVHPDLFRSCQSDIYEHAMTHNRRIMQLANELMENVAGRPKDFTPSSELEDGKLHFYTLQENGPPKKCSVKFATRNEPVRNILLRLFSAAGISHEVPQTASFSSLLASRSNETVFRKKSAISNNIETSAPLFFTSSLPDTGLKKAREYFLASLWPDIQKQIGHHHHPWCVFVVDSGFIAHTVLVDAAIVLFRFNKSVL